MSLEAALEEERLEILKLLERPQNQSRAYQHPSGAQSQPSSPRVRYSSLTSSPSSPSPPIRPVTSLIDAASDLPPSGTTSSASSMHTPSLPPAIAGGIMYRTRSDAASNRPNAQLTDLNEAFNLSMIPSMAAGTGLPRKRHGSSSSKVYGRSSSPFSPAFRSQSPRGQQGRLASPPPQPAETKHKLLSEHGQLIDLDYAYARLTDDALAGSGGVLESLPERRAVMDRGGEHIRAGSGESLTQDGGVRLQKDVDANSESAVADSSEDDSSDNDSEDGSQSDEGEEQRRGRTGQRSPKSMIDAGEGSRSRGDSSEREIKSMLGVDPGGRRKAGKKKQKQFDAAKPRRKTTSLLAAAEEERKQVSSKYKVRSLLPSISVTPSIASLPGATSPTTARRSGVHPSTNFDVNSTASTPVSSDHEADDMDLRRAQRMEMTMSPIFSTPESHRVFRTIIRGDYSTVASDIEAGSRRARKYLVATDLSSEAQYAMEWTIGTVLRDGDTLMAIYAADQDTVEDGGKTVSESSIGDALAEVPNQAQETALLTPTIQQIQAHQPGMSSPLREGIIESSRERTKAERERYVAAEAITGVIAKLLRKTRLQVKVVIEVIHCKSPKHLITEIIDLCEPTLVILGSRGRSALKGVLLGSFSNYLVTKSSVPVMVARKKLKQTKKYVQANVRFSNNLVTRGERVLANAKVD